jgi:hypothetical protein
MVFILAGLQYDLAHLQPQHERYWADEDDTTATPTMLHERAMVTATGPVKQAQARLPQQPMWCGACLQMTPPVRLCGTYETTQWEMDNGGSPSAM